MKQSRRDFIKMTSVVSVSVIPAVKELANTLDVPMYQFNHLIDHDFNYALEFHLIDNNLLNLHFYFINVCKKKGFLYKNSMGNAFMVVRLPQMHLSESGFFDDQLDKNVTASMSGFSYLAFQLWPEVETDNLKDDASTEQVKRMPFTVCNFLNWTDSVNFDLITLVEWFSLKKAKGALFPYQEYVGNRANFYKAKTLTTSESEEAKSRPTETYAPKSRIFAKYYKIVNKFLDEPLHSEQLGNNSFVPVTIFEMPQEACVVPIYRNRDKKLGKNPGEKVDKIFWPNIPVNDGLSSIIPPRYEVWNNTLYLRRQNLDKTNSKQTAYTYEIPGLRIVGLVTDRPFWEKKRGENCGDDKEKDFNVLPSLLDKTELAYLLQYADHSTDNTKKFSDIKFDLTIKDGLFFTGLGVCTHLYYSNRYAPEGISLIEYEHKISEGRDVFIKVSRLGYNSKTGQPYKHTIEGQRVIDWDEPSGNTNAYSYINFKQYCECLDKEMDYSDADTLADPAKFPKITTPFVNNIVNQAFLNDFNLLRLPFTKFITFEPKSIPIDCLKNQVVARTIPDLECVDWFWPILESSDNFNGDTEVAGKSDTEIPTKRYLFCENEAIDREGKSVTAKTPFIFIRKDYIEKQEKLSRLPNAEPIYCELYDNYYKGTYQNNDEPQHPFIDRRRNYFENAKISYTKSQRGGGGKPFESKVNNIETVFIESYFHIRKFTIDELQTLSYRKYVVFPQLLQAQTFLDHIRDLTLRKLPSYIDYHEKYLFYKFDEVKNYGAQIVQHTKAFRDSLNADADAAQRTINNQRDSLLNALQEAKDRLGNFVIPDIKPETVSLKEFGITLPVDAEFHQIHDQKYLDPKQLIPGKFAEILGGLDLKQVLKDLIPEGNTPLFQLQKFTNQITDEITDSEVYRLIKEDIQNVRDKVKELENGYLGLINDINQKKNQINGALKIISNNIPNSEQLKNLINKQFEQKRTEAFDLSMDLVQPENVLSEIVAKARSAKDFMDNELAVLEVQIMKNCEQLSLLISEVGSLLKDLGDVDIGHIPPELLELAGLSFEDYLTKKLLSVYHDAVRPDIDDYIGKLSAIYSTVPDDVPLTGLTGDLFNLTIQYDIANFQLKPSGGIAIYIFNPATTDLTKIGYVQLDAKLNFFRKLILKNINGNKFQQAAVLELQSFFKKDGRNYITRYKELQLLITHHQDGKLATISNDITTWKNRYNLFNQTVISVAGRDTLRKLQDLILKTIPWVDQLRKIDPYFYYQQFIRLKKDAEDIRTRFQVDLAKAYDTAVTNFDKIQDVVNKYNKAYETFRKDLNYTTFVSSLNNANGELEDVSEQVLEIVRKYPVYAQANTAMENITHWKGQIKDYEKRYQINLQSYQNYVRANAGTLQDDISGIIAAFIIKWQDKIDFVNEAKNLYNLFINLKQQDLTYTWSTDDFRDVNFGIVAFKTLSSPKTQLQVNVRVTTIFTSNKLPPTIEKIETYSENRITNFGISVFSIFTVIFSEASFIAGSDHSTHFNIKIREVQFDGALSFVQKLQEFLKTLDTGLVLDLEPDHVALGYCLPIPDIQAPGFAFFNLTLTFDFRLYFDKRPMQLGFSFATAEKKFGIAVYIYAGFGFFTIVAEPKRGIVSIDAALEAGVWAGFSLGPIHGEVKLAFGFRYTKGDFGVRLEGYFVVEGRLSIWIIEVSARIYLGIISQNSYVEGSCIVTYSVKLGFFKKSFSGTFHKKIAGAETTPQQSAAKSFDANEKASRELNAYFKNSDLQDSIRIIALSALETFRDMNSKEAFIESKLADPDPYVTDTFSVTQNDWDKYFIRFAKK